MTPQAIRCLFKALSLVSIAAGAYGILLCMPYAFSRYIPVIATAGIYFCSGSVLIAGGIVGYVILLKQEKVPAVPSVKD